MSECGRKVRWRGRERGTGRGEEKFGLIEREGVGYLERYLRGRGELGKELVF